MLVRCYKWRNVELWVHTFTVWLRLFHIAQEYWLHRTIFQVFSSSFWETLLFSDKRFSKRICNTCIQLAGRVVRSSKCDCERKNRAQILFFFNLGLFCSCIFPSFTEEKQVMYMWEFPAISGNDVSKSIVAQQPKKRMLANFLLHLCASYSPKPWGMPLIDTGKRLVDPINSP